MPESAQLFAKLRVWHDQTPRSGAENMAVDQLLMESGGGLPVLRVYSWSEPTVSFGYFHTLSEAVSSFAPSPGEKLHYVRRWTGGGVVDHRVDVTYTLVIPGSEALARTRGAESYRVIHRALAEVLAGNGEPVRLTDVHSGSGGAQCFTNPVAYDLTDPSGKKVAGAGQRRSRYGLLHQGSVIPKTDTDVFRRTIPNQLAAQLAGEWVGYQPAQGVLDMSVSLAQKRYASQEWLRKR